MAFNRGQLIQRLKELNLPKDKYVLIAGGAMVMHGLRKKTNDLDISVDPDLFQKILDGKHKFGAIELKPPEYIKGGFKKNAIIRIANDVEISSGGKSLISRSPVETDGVRHQSLRDIYGFKKKLNRPKDQKDLEVLENAIARENRLNPRPEFKRKEYVYGKRATPRSPPRSPPTQKVEI